MKIREKLNLMKKIDEDNRKHIEEFIQAHMKIWVVDFAFIDRDGMKREWEPAADDPDSEINSNRNDFQIQVKALNIRDALDAGEKLLKEKREESGWLEFIITDVGICNMNIW